MSALRDATLKMRKVIKASESKATVTWMWFRRSRVSSVQKNDVMDSLSSIEWGHSLFSAFHHLFIPSSVGWLELMFFLYCGQSELLHEIYSMTIRSSNGFFRHDPIFVHVFTVTLCITSSSSSTLLPTITSSVHVSITVIRGNDWMTLWFSLRRWWVMIPSVDLYRKSTCDSILILQKAWNGLFCPRQLKR